MVSDYTRRVLIPQAQDAVSNKPIETWDNAQVYWNLTRHCFSVRVRVGAKWKVMAHADQCIVQQPKFKVNEAGRIRVVHTHHKTVHAVIEGRVHVYHPSFTGPLVVQHGDNVALLTKQGTLVKYNPLKSRYFEAHISEGNTVTNRVALTPGRQEEGIDGAVRCFTQAWRAKDDQPPTTHPCMVLDGTTSRNIWNLVRPNLR